MKTLVILLFLSLSFLSTSAQEYPNNPEDISPLLIGETVPNSPLESPSGEKTTLNEIVSRKPTVLVFFRGGWCPFCNAHLLELRKVLTTINDLDYQLVAISPDSFKNLTKLVEKQDLNYYLYSDIEQKAMLDFGIAYKAPEKYVSTIKKYSEGRNVTLLPVPAVFILNTDGTIQFEYINPDHTTRIKGNELVAQLKILKNS